MSLFTLPASVRQVFAGLRQGDIPAAQAGFLNEAVLTEGGRRYRGETLGAWLEARATGHIDRAINESSVSGRVVVTTFCTARPASGQAPAREHDWTFEMQGERISAVDVAVRRRPSLPVPLEAFVVAVNRLDVDALVATFADNALVNDQLAEHSGKPAICEWAKCDVVGVELALYVVDVVLRNGHATMTGHVSGNFDMRGLPDPLVLRFYFSARGDRIVQLIILRRVGEL